MGQAAPSQHPAVVPRSHYTLVRRLLAIAMIAVAGLTVAVVILAGDSDEVSSTSAAKPVESIRYGDFNPATGRPESAGSTRYDGAPEEGTDKQVPAPPPSIRDDSRVVDGTRGVAPKDYTKNSATGDVAPRGSKPSDSGTSQYRPARP
jgi:hypothetical protein